MGGAHRQLQALILVDGHGGVTHFLLEDGGGVSVWLLVILAHLTPFAANDLGKLQKHGQVMREPGTASKNWRRPMWFDQDEMQLQEYYRQNQHHNRIRKTGGTQLCKQMGSGGANLAAAVHIYSEQEGKTSQKKQNPTTCACHAESYVV